VLKDRKKEQPRDRQFMEVLRRTLANATIAKVGEHAGGKISFLLVYHYQRTTYHSSSYKLELQTKHHF
jgi:hypothetical protein